MVAFGYFFDVVMRHEISSDRFDANEHPFAIRPILPVARDVVHRVHALAL
jgi:hypothetical protein